MAGRTLPGLGLTGFYNLGEDGWGDDMSTGLRLLSAVVQLRVISLVAAEPESPADGDIYILTGTSNANKLAVRDNGEWVYITPAQGWIAFIADTQQYRKFVGTSWSLLIPDSSAPPEASDVPYNGGSGGPENVQDALDELFLLPGGGGVDVSFDDGTPISPVTQLNFTGSGVSVINDGSGKVTIDIPAGGGGGSTPTLVQSKGAVLADPSLGLTLDSAPTEGNLLVAYVGRASTASIAVGAGWTPVSTATATGLYVKRAGAGESATQTPTSISLIAGIAIWEFSDARGLDLVTATVGRATTTSFTLTHPSTPVPGYVVSACHRTSSETPTITGAGSPGSTNAVSSPSDLTLSWWGFDANEDDPYSSVVTYGSNLATGRATIRVV